MSVEEKADNKDTPKLDFSLNEPRLHASKVPFIIDIKKEEDI